MQNERAVIRRCSMKKAFLKYFAKFTEKCLCMRPTTLWKKRLRHRCVLMKFAKFLRTSFFVKWKQKPMTFSSVFDHFVRLALKGLNGWHSKLPSFVLASTQTSFDCNVLRIFYSVFIGCYLSLYTCYMEQIGATSWKK